MKKYKVTEITTTVCIYGVEAKDSVMAETKVRHGVGHMPEYDDVTDRVYEIEEESMDRVCDE